MLLLGFELEEKDRLRECGGANALRGPEQLRLAVGVPAVRHPEDLYPVSPPLEDDSPISNA